MKKYLAPSMLAADFSKLGEQINKIEESGAEILHVDVMDGLFVPSISFGMPVIQSIRNKTGLKFDVHMMVVDPERYILAMRESGADIISVHVEACKNPGAVLRAIKEMGATPALALNPETPVEKLIPYLSMCEQVVVMSVNPGFGGQAFIEEVYNKIVELKDIREKMMLHFLIEVDGGIKLNNVDKVLSSGADIIVAGSAVFNDNIEQSVKDFNEKLVKYEV